MENFDISKVGVKVDLDNLTEKEYAVLIYFIEKESEVMNGGSFCEYMIKKFSAEVRKCIDGEKHFLSYPGKIEKDTTKYPIMWPTKDKGGNSGYKSGKISRAWAGNICKEFEIEGIFDHELIRPPRRKEDTKYYFLRHDHEAFCKIIRSIAGYTTSKDLVSVFSNYYFQKRIDESFVKKVLSDRHVKMNRSIKLWDWKPTEAKKLFKDFSDEINFEEVVNKSLEENYQGHKLLRRNISDMPTISLNLPVFEEQIEEKERLSKLEELNMSNFAKYHLLSFSSVINEHYDIWQREKIILPLLALCRASPKALFEFIFGEWEYREPKGWYSSDTLGNLDYGLFRILFTAISDIALTRYVPVDVENVVMRPPYSTPDGQYPLLMIPFRNFITVYYDGGFDTSEIYIGTDLLKKPDESHYWFKSSITYGYTLRKENIENYPGFISCLTDRNNKKSRYVFSKLSNQIKNIITCLDLNREFPKKIIEDLVKDLNRLLIQNDFFREGKLILEQSSDLSEYTKRSISIYEDDPFVLPCLCNLSSLNLSVLEDMFPDYIIKDQYRV